MGNDLYDWELVAVCLDKGNIADSRLFLENQGKMSGAAPLLLDLRPKEVRFQLEALFQQIKGGLPAPRGLSSTR